MKRARYDGPSLAVEVQIPDVPAFAVERGHLLPLDVDGVNVPAKVRDELTARPDWSEVEQNPPSTKRDEPPTPAKKED